MLDREALIHYIADKMANPFDTRSWLEVAKELDIPHSTFYKFKSEHIDKISHLADNKRPKYQALIRSAAYNALISRLPKSDKAIELAFKLLGDLVERSESKIEYMSADEKREKLRTMLDTLSQRLAKNEKTNGEKEATS